MGFPELIVFFILPTPYLYPHPLPTALPVHPASAPYIPTRSSAKLPRVSPVSTSLTLRSQAHNQTPGF